MNNFLATEIKALLKKKKKRPFCENKCFDGCKVGKFQSPGSRNTSQEYQQTQLQESVSLVGIFQQMEVTTPFGTTR